MSEFPKVKPAPDVLFQTLEGEAVLLNLSNEKYYGLNEVGARMWQLLEEQDDLELVINTMLAEYDVEEARLRQDLGEIVSTLQGAGLLIQA